MTETVRGKFVFYLAVAPFYRLPCFKLLRARLGSELHIYASESHLDRSVKTGLPEAWFTRVRMIRFFGRGFLQFGGILHALRSQTCVVDLNPRSMTAWCVLVMRRIRGRRTLVWGHVNPQGGASAPTAPLRRAMMSISSGAICYTHRDAEQLIASGYARVWAAPNAMMTKDQIRRITATSTQKRDHIIYVGRLEIAKKVDKLLSCFSKVATEIDELKLVIVGDGSCRDALEAQCRELALEDRVTFTGWIQDIDKLAPLYNRAIASASPGFAGLGLTQSLAFGVPQIISRVEPHSPEIELADYGGVIWADSQQDWIAAIRDVYAARARLPLEQQRQVIHDQYSADAMADGLIAALTDTRLGEHGG